jgi:hypothetical protein
MLLLVENALNNGNIEPNQGNRIDHVYKIAGHKGNTWQACSQERTGKIKVVIDETLKNSGYDYFKEVEHGNFLVRI